jgi:hypothetical protein
MLVMPALVVGIHVFETAKDVDGRDKPGHFYLSAFIVIPGRPKVEPGIHNH